MKKISNSSLPQVSVIIPSFNSKNNVLELLDSLFRINYKNLEVIVVDNGSGDGSIEAIKRKFPSVILVDAGKKNIGLTGSRNLGIRIASKKSDYLLFMDSDTIAEKNMIWEFVKFLKEHPKCGIITPMILYSSNKKWVNQAGSYVDLFTGKVKIGWGPVKNFKKPMQVQNSGTVLFVDKKVIDAIGGFDDQLFMCYEDVDFCLRARNAGFEIWYCPKAVAYHNQSIDENNWRPRVLGRSYALGRNRTLVLKKYSPFFTAYLLLVPLYILYYTREAIKYKKAEEIYRFIKGNIDGLLSSLEKSNYIEIPNYRYRIIA